jgi:SAM-dependent methyltransferase
VRRSEALPSWFPQRYQEPWLEPFTSRCLAGLDPGAHILDIGGGRRPSLAPADRPPGCRYVGFDASAQQLALAGPGAYDELRVGSATEHVPGFEGAFDLVTSWQTLEHVRPVEAALANARSYLRVGGRFVALVSGTFAVFAIAGRLVPHSVARAVMKRLLDREPETVFPAHYNRCWHGTLVKLLEPWSHAEVIPLYRAGGYFAFSDTLARAYLAYENWAEGRQLRNLATHYLIDAVR